MKLQDLELIKTPQDKAQAVLESRLGHTASFRHLPLNETKKILEKVRTTLEQYRSSKSYHVSEDNASYLKMLMLEQGLASRLAEMENSTVMVPIDTKDPKIQQTLQKAEKGQTLSPDEQKTINAIATQKKEARKQKKKMVKESELQQAQVVLAAQDMLDRVQDMLEDVSEMQFKDLPALVNSIKNDMGTDQASAFQRDASSALSGLLTAVETAKTALESAQGVLTGQEPVVPGEEETVDDLGLDDNDLGLDLDDQEQDQDAIIPPRENEDDDDDEAGAETLGRERR